MPGGKIRFRVKGRGGRKKDPEEKKGLPPGEPPGLKPGAAGKTYHNPFNIGIIGKGR
jgi:hypothetical protein